MEESAIVALQQAEISIAGLMIMAVLLPDGQTGMVFSLLCEALGLNYRKQVHILRSQPDLRSSLVLVKIQTAGGPQAVNVLVSWGIPLWLNGVRSGPRSPEERKRLFIMRREANAALARLFFQPPAAPQSSPAPELEIVEALPPGPDPLLERYRREVEQYRRELNATRRLLAAAIERVLQHEGRLEYLESLYRKWQRAKQPDRTRKHKR